MEGELIMMTIPKSWVEEQDGVVFKRWLLHLKRILMEENTYLGRLYWISKQGLGVMTT